MPKKCFALSVFAGAAMATSSLAQVADPDHAPVGQGTLTMAHDGGYNGRAVGVVYDNFSTIGSSGLYLFLSGTGKKIISHIKFTDGPWATQAGRTITAIDYAAGNPAGAPAGTVMEQFAFYADGDVNFDGFSGPGTDMIRPGATPIGNPASGYHFRSASHTYAANNGSLWANNTLTTPVVVPDGATGIWVVATIIDPATGQQPASTAATGTFILGCNTGATTPDGSDSTNTPNNNTFADPTSPGDTDLSYGRDVSNDGTILGTPFVGTPNAAASPSNGGNGIAGSLNNERRFVKIQTATGSSDWWSFNLAFGVRGDIQAVQPACQTFTLGADNTFATDTTAMAANGVKWYCFDVPAGGAVDGVLKYIDFDTETSAADAAMALYDSTGTLIAADDDSGSGVNAQMSFGIGRRAAVGDGLQYDGRFWDGLTGDLGLPAGTSYYLAVAASSNGASFGDGWSATGNGAAGNITTRIRTNVNGGALDPSVPPISTRIVGASQQDPIVAPGGQTGAVALFGPGVLWWDVQLCQAADTNNPVSFDATGSTYAHAMVVFDSNGNVVGQGTGTDTVGAVVNFGGGNPALPAGHYYVGMTFDPGWNLAPSPTTAGRWHFRGQNGSAGFTLQVAVSVPWSNCLSVCCRNDYNGDGAVGTDADIEAFFACLSGNCCATCPPNADFNCDGAVGTDADIESFFRVLSGGAC
jgi:hypothetical protein